MCLFVRVVSPELKKEAVIVYVMNLHFERLDLQKRKEKCLPIGCDMNFYSETTDFQKKRPSRCIAGNVLPHAVRIRCARYAHDIVR